jgi:membrane protease YdiL (CAAX protease family)
MPSKAFPRDLLIYFAFCALPIAGFWLLGDPSVAFDTALLTISLVVLFGFKIYYNDRASARAEMLLDWDENLNADALIYIIFGVIGSLAVATFLATRFTGSLTWVSSIYVPVTKLSLQVGTTTLPKFWSDVLFTITLVVTAEETAKLVTSLGLYLWLKDFIGQDWGKTVAIGAPIMGWAALHTFENPSYQGQYWYVFVGSAFVAGLLMYYAMYKTKSLLAAMIIHLVYNTVILYMTEGLKLA